MAGKRWLVMLLTTLFLVLSALSTMAQEELSDADIRSATIADLTIDGSIPQQRIDATVMQDVVTLGESVYNIYARNTVGVWSVIKQIEVRPDPFVNDNEIVS